MIRKQDILAFIIFVLIAALAAIITFFLQNPFPPASPTPTMAEPYSITVTVAVTKTPARQARVIVDVAALRGGPSVESDLVGIVQQSEIVIVVGISPAEEWYLVALSGPQGSISQAWIMAEFVEFVTVTPTLAPSNAPTIEITAAEPTVEATIMPSATFIPSPVATQPRPSFPTATPLPPEEPPPSPSASPSVTPRPTTPSPPPAPSDTTEPGPPTVIPPTKTTPPIWPSVIPPAPSFMPPPAPSFMPPPAPSLMPPDP